MCPLYSHWSEPFPPENSDIELNSSESQHLSKALRAQPKDTVILFGSQAHCKAQVLPLQGDRLFVRTGKVQKTRPQTPRITLLQALPKGKTFQGILRAATELGVAEFLPLRTKHSEFRTTAKRLEVKMRQWNQTLIAACKQSGNLNIPLIQAPQSLQDQLKAQAPQAEQLRIVASLEPHAKPIKELINTKIAPKPAEIHCLIGPEGDFSPEEYESIARSGYKAARLTQTTLKVDTAAIALLSILRCCLNPKL